MRIAVASSVVVIALALAGCGAPPSDPAVAPEDVAMGLDEALGCPNPDSYCASLGGWAAGSLDCSDHVSRTGYGDNQTMTCDPGNVGQWEKWEIDMSLGGYGYQEYGAGSRPCDVINYGGYDIIHVPWWEGWKSCRADWANAEYYYIGGGLCDYCASSYQNHFVHNEGTACHAMVQCQFYAGCHVTYCPW